MGGAKKKKADAALIQAALSGEKSQVIAMLKKHDVAAVDAQGNHVLVAAACGGHLELVKELLDLGAPMELANGIGTTALWLSAGYGHVDLLNFLISAKADVNAPNSTKDTPMLAAASKGHTACVAALCAAGARGLTVNKTGDSPLSLAAAAGNLEMLTVLVGLPGSAALVKRKNAKGVHPVAVAAASESTCIKLDRAGRRRRGRSLFKS